MLLSSTIKEVITVNGMRRIIVGVASGESGTSLPHLKSLPGEGRSGRGIPPPPAHAGIEGSVEYPAQASSKMISWAPSQSVLRPSSRSWSSPSTMVAKWFPVSGPALLPKAADP